MFQDPNLVPEHLRNWKANEVIWKPGEKFVEAESCFRFHTDDGEIIPLARKKEMVILTGKEKSRKTTLLQSINLSAYIQEKPITFGFELDLDGPILHFDTEQSLALCNYNRSKFHYLSKKSENDEWYRTFSLKQMSSHNMFDFITHVIDEVSNEVGFPPGLIAIDQLADLMPGRDVNSPEGVDNIINHLNIWAQLTEALMLNVIHTNRAGMETNGLLGSMLDKKTDCTFHCAHDTDSNITTVTHKHSRGKRIPKFTFRHDEYGNPEFLKSLEQDHKL